MYFRESWRTVVMSRSMMMRWILIMRNSQRRVTSATSKIPGAEAFVRNDQPSSVRRRRLYCRYVWNTCTKYWRGNLIRWFIWYLVTFGAFFASGWYCYYFLLLMHFVWICTLSVTLIIIIMLSCSGLTVSVVWQSLCLGSAGLMVTLDTLLFLTFKLHREFPQRVKK